MNEEKDRRSIYGRVDTEKALDLKSRGLSYQDIASIMQVSKQAVYQKIARLLPNPSDLQAYKDIRPELFATKQALILEHLNEGVVQQMMTRQPGAAALWFNSLYNNERLERGQASHIEEHRTIVATLDEARERMRQAGLLKGEETPGGVE